MQKKIKRFFPIILTSLILAFIFQTPLFAEEDKKIDSSTTEKMSGEVIKQIPKEIIDGKKIDPSATEKMPVEQTAKKITTEIPQMKEKPLEKSTASEKTSKEIIDENPSEKRTEPQTEEKENKKIKSKEVNG